MLEHNVLSQLNCEHDIYSEDIWSSKKNPSTNYINVSISWAWVAIVIMINKATPSMLLFNQIGFNLGLQLVCNYKNTTSIILTTNVYNYF